MALTPIRLPRLPSSTQFTDPKTGMPTKRGQQWWQRAMEQIEAGVNGVIEAQNAADIATAAAATAQAAADAAQAAADTAQATVDGLDIPPTDSITVSTNTVLSGNENTVLVDATGGAVTITLFAASVALSSLVITKIDASINAVNVTPQGGDQLNGGGGSVAITTQNAPRTFVSDGTSEWFG